MFVQSMPLARTADALRSGELKLIDFIEQVLKRLDDIDPQIQAFLPEEGRRERLLREAEALQTRYPHPEERPPLYGVPVGVKDIFRVDGLPTRAGSHLPPELFDGAEAWCVSSLRRNGALVLGKTVTTEFAYFEPGPTRNPHNPAHTPGGSSSGSAAGVAAGMCLLGIGSQTIGSVIRPAAFCGIVGYKPSYGRIDPEGVIYCAPSLDHVGLFAQDVAGIELAASVLCRDWQADETAEAGRLPVLGVPDGRYLDQASPEALEAYERQVAQLQAAGYGVERVYLLADIAEIDHRHRELMAYEMAQVHRDWFAEFEPRYRPRTADLIRRGQAVDRVAAQAALDGQEIVRRTLETRMADTGVDIWISPAATGPAPEGIASTGDPVMNLPWTHTGFPTVTVPAGRAQNGLPLGLQCASRYGADARLLGWTRGIERVFQEKIG
jgi:Asp-tRNA(Asn)/Glu-tRNA(Gln) amidotransferase A subunit family amidase